MKLIYPLIPKIPSPVKHATEEAWDDLFCPINFEVLEIN